MVGQVNRRGFIGGVLALAATLKLEGAEQHVMPRYQVGDVFPCKVPCRVVAVHPDPLPGVLQYVAVCKEENFNLPDPHRYTVYFWYKESAWPGNARHCGSAQIDARVKEEMDWQMRRDVKGDKE